jgi:gas vesicle protein
MSEKKNNFGLGLFIGGLTAGLATFFLTPKSGKENRQEVVELIKKLKQKIDESKLEEKAREIFGKATKETKDVYQKLTKQIIKELEELNQKIQDIDKDKYIEVVEKAWHNLGDKVSKYQDKLIVAKEKLGDSFEKKNKNKCEKGQDCKNKKDNV